MQRVGWRTGLTVVAGAAVLWACSRLWSRDRLPVANPIVVTRAFIEHPDTVHHNETLSDLFARHNIVGAQLLNVLSVAHGLHPRRIRPGKVFDFQYGLNDSVPARVKVRVSDDRILWLERSPDGSWVARPEDVTWTVNTEQVRGEIHSSLYEALQRTIPDSTLPDAARDQLAWDLADGVYPWTIDFTRDIYPGDHFDVIYEVLTSSLGEVRFGRVVAADVETRGQENTAYLLPDPNGGNAYYDASGRSLRRAFKRYPVQFRRISSNFSMSRLNPVLGIRRPHLGTDYAAPIGTPIEATGDGVVIRAGRWGGYGIMVAIRHPHGIETRYAHMHRIAPGIHPGVHVHQGQYIGQVGMTGLATGPHVHYEFIKDGRHLNPRAVNLGTGRPVPVARRAEFDSLKAHYDRLLELPTRSDERKVD